jgi:hypothetical protein
VPVDVVAGDIARRELVMTRIDTVFEELTSDPTAWAHLQKELAAASDPRGRFLELAAEQGLSVDPAELSTILEQARRELGEGELDQVSGGAMGSFGERAFNPQPEPPGEVLFKKKSLIGLLLPAVQK